MKYNFTLITALAITILSTIPIPDVPELDDVPFVDKWVHFVMYGGLAMAMWLDWYVVSRTGREKVDKLLGASTTRWALLAFVLPFALGGVLELVQAYLTTCRSGEWLDFWADGFGALLGTILSLIIWKLVKTSAAR